MDIHDWQAYRAEHRLISVLTCYDYTFARILNTTNIDALLVGDSLAMVMHGHNSTLNATVDMMTLHVKAVSQGAPDKFIIADMPFLSDRQGLPACMEAIRKLMSAGAQAIKLEGSVDQLDLITHIVNSGVPVMGHLGLTPQSVNALGGYKVQGREQKAAEKILTAAKALEAAGCFAIVLECVPITLAKTITNSLSIPTIGIGAGSEVSGQVLVLHDMLGLQTEFKPKFVKHYLPGAELVSQAVNQYVSEVSQSLYPQKEHSFHDHSNQKPQQVANTTSDA